VLRVCPKSDLHPQTSPYAKAPPGHACGNGTSPPAPLSVSARTGHNLDRLRQGIRRALGERAVSVNAESLALQPRHEAALAAAADHVAAAHEHLDPGARQLDQIEWVAGSLRLALDELAGLGGRLTPDDVIGQVFATFCVGK
jgi:tRNA modification GTPase